jgi:aminotransferase
MPSGLSLNDDEWRSVAQACERAGAWLIYDAAMENIRYDGQPYLHPARLPHLAERTITVGSAAKEFRMIGWRVGWVIAPADLTAAIRKVHDFLTVGAAAPLQAAGAVALALPDIYYDSLRAGYQERRDVLVAALRSSGFRVFVPDGAYYVMTDVSDLTDKDDVAFALALAESPGVATVPGSSFRVANRTAATMTNSIPIASGHLEP